MFSDINTASCSTWR